MEIYIILLGGKQISILFGFLKINFFKKSGEDANVKKKIKILGVLEKAK